MNIKPDTLPTSNEKTSRYAYYALGILTLVNFLNYIDRQVLPAVAPFMFDDPKLKLTDTELGLMEMALLLSYTVFAPIFGRLGDKYPRAKLMAVAAVIWSFVTSLTGFVEYFPFLPESLQLHVPRGLHLIFGETLILSGIALAMCVIRAFVGIGESAYSTITPSLIADYFPPQKRATALGIFQAAIPMGFALGFVIGGVLANFFGWRAAFMIVGIPGLITAALVWKLKEPKRGLSFSEDNDPLQNSELQDNELPALAHDPSTAAFTSQEAEGKSPFYLSWRIIKSRDWFFSTMGYTMLTAALGAFSTWATVLLERDKGMGKTASAVTLGIVVLTAGAAGTFGGGWIADKFATGDDARRQRVYFVFCAVGTLFSIFPLLAALIFDNPYLFLPAIFLTVVLLFVNNAPFQMILLQSVPISVRSLAIALNIVVIHTFGDAISRFVVGALSDSLKEGNLSALAGLGAAIGIDSTHTLSIALLLAPLTLLASTIFFFIGSKHKQVEG